MIPFNKPYMTVLGYIAEAHANGHLAGDGMFTRRCHSWLEKRDWLPESLANALVHGCPGNGGHSGRCWNG